MREPAIAPRLRFPSLRAMPARRRLVLAAGIIAASGLGAVAAERLVVPWDGRFPAAAGGAAPPPPLEVSMMMMGKALVAGEPAPDFRLAELRSGRSIGLSDFRHRKPAFLVFSSFT